MEHEGLYQPPQMCVSHTFLDFGTIDPQEIQNKPPQIQLQIKNIGGGVLVGNIHPQINWISVYPPSFKLPAEKSSEHQIIINPNFPCTASWRNFSFDSIIFINSNGGAISLAGSYLSAPAVQKRNISLNWLMISMPVITIAAIFFLIYEGIRLRNVEIPTPVPEINILYTQAANTAFVQFTHTALANSSIIGLSTPTFTPSISSNAGIQIEQTATSQETPTPKLTFTPLPTNRFQNPEEFIHDYYLKINKREYNLTWAMLTDNFQESCCNVFGSDPYNTYVNFWNSVDSIEVVSAYLQEWNANPVPVVVTLLYHYSNGEEVEDSRVFYLIADTELNTLLIDEVK